MTNDDARRLIQDFAADAAQRSRLAEPQRSDARAELESHLFDAAAALSKPAAPSREHARAAIAGLGGPDAVDTAFFAPHRSGAPRATWGVRIGAFLLDALIVLVATTVIMVPFEPVWHAYDDMDAADGSYDCQRVVYFGIKFWSRDEYSGADNPCDDMEAAQVLHQVLHAAGFLLYFGFFEGTVGRTPGKMALGLRVLRDDGTPAGLGPAFGRTITKVLFPLIVLDWLFGLGTKERRQRISDVAAHTMVVRER